MMETICIQPQFVGMQYIDPPSATGEFDGIDEPTHEYNVSISK